jgi:hypothetical protein
MRGCPSPAFFLLGYRELLPRRKGYMQINDALFYIEPVTFTSVNVYT